MPCPDCQQARRNRPNPTAFALSAPFAVIKRPANSRCIEKLRRRPLTLTVNIHINRILFTIQTKALRALANPSRLPHKGSLSHGCYSRTHAEPSYGQDERKDSRERQAVRHFAHRAKRHAENHSAADRKTVR